MILYDNNRASNEYHIFCDDGNDDNDCIDDYGI